MGRQNELVSAVTDKQEKQCSFWIIRRRNKRLQVKLEAAQAFTDSAQLSTLQYV